MSDVKVYVPVSAIFTATGEVRPMALVWEDGHVFEIDKVLDVRPAPALKAGGHGDRYTVLINGKTSYLFFERTGLISGTCLGRWFVERKGLQ